MGDAGEKSSAALLTIMRMPIYGIALTFLVAAFAAEGNVDTVPMSFYADAELSKVTSLYQFVALSAAPYGIKISPEEFAQTMSESKWDAAEQKDDDRDKNAEGVYRHYLDGKDEMKTSICPSQESVTIAHAVAHHANDGFVC